jgi:hypothetical protein
VYIKFKNADKACTFLHESGGQKEYKHDNGMISTVKIEPAGMGIRIIRIANLPPEVNDRTIVTIFSKYGDVRELKEETWS